MILRYTILYVDDVPSTLDFFERAFGLQRGFLHESGDYGELKTGETKLAFSSTALMQQLEKNPAAPNAKSPTFEIAFETENVKAALERAIDAGGLLQVSAIPTRRTAVLCRSPRNASSPSVRHPVSGSWLPLSSLRPVRPP